MTAPFSILLLGLAIGPQENAAPIPPVPYKTHTVRLEVREGERARQQELEQLRLYGEFQERDAGETIELAALRLGLDPARLRDLNPPEVAELCPTALCLGFHHRCFPGETLARVAELYRSEVPLLRRLNGLSEDEEVAAWSRLTVPAPIETANGRAWLELPAPDWTKVDPGDEDLKFDHRMRSHTVVEGDDWDSIAQRAFCSAETLRRVNPQNQNERGISITHTRNLLKHLEPGAGDLVLGVELNLGLVLLRDPQRSLSALVLYLEHVLRVDLETVLEANEIERVEQLAGLEGVYLPFSKIDGYGAPGMQGNCLALSPLVGATGTRTSTGGWGESFKHRLEFR